MRLLGLTGGIATGKSTVAAMLEAHGAAVVDADLVAREVVEPGGSAIAEIARAFGPGVIGGDGRLDRAALGSIVFADPEQRHRLDAITHPRIAELMSRRVAAALDGGAPLVVADIPLLFENGREATVEATLVVYAPADVQVRRLQSRDGLSEADARQRLSAQMPIDDKRELATWIIENTGSVAATAAAVDDWWSAVVGGS